MEKESGARSGKSHRIVIAVVVTVIAVLAALAGIRLLGDYLNPQIEAVDDAVRIKVEGAKTGNIEVTSVHTGKVTAKNEVNVIPKIPGKVTSVKVALGDVVKSGDALFKIDPGDVKSQQSQAQIQLDAASKGRKAAAGAVSDAKDAKKKADKSLRDIKKKINDAKKARKKAEQAGPMGLQALAEAQAALQQLESAKAQAEAGVTQAKAGVTQARSAYDQSNAQYKLAGEGVSAAKDALKETTVRAPISGYVTGLTVQRGGMASQAMAAVVITGTGKLQVTTTVAENIVGSLKVGEKVEALVRAVADEPFAGSIRSIVPAPPAGQTTYPVIIGLDEPSDALKPGMLVEVNMATGAAENVVTIPSDSVIIRGGQEVVAVLDSANKVRIAEVETGLDDGERVEIKSGVAAGDNVIYEGQHYVDADSNVKVVE